MKTFLIVLLLFQINQAFAEKVNSIREYDLTTIEKLGKEIYDQDLIAAEATDILFEQNIDLTKIPIRGWDVIKKNNQTVVYFIAEYDNEYYAVFEISKKGNQKAKFQKLNKQRLNENVLNRFKARQLTTTEISPRCTEKYNLVVTMEPNTSNIIVYALAASTDPDAIIVGGHFRFIVSMDGKRIIQKDQLFKGCLVLDKTPEELPKGATLKAYTMNHIVSDTPVETHVFLNLYHKKPFFIGTTDNSVWQISEGKITKIQ